MLWLERRGTGVFEAGSRSSMMRWLGWIVVGWCVVVSVVSCGGGGECKNGIQLADYNTSGLKCAASCDCSNLKYEGYCVSGVCLSSERTSAQRKGEIRPCKLQQKVGACEWGKQEAQPEPLKELVWGDCIPPTLRPENTLDTCLDNEDNDCNGLTDLNDLGCAAFCRVGDAKTCYRGPEGTQNVGECRGGTISCKPDRTWGVCEGEALPQKETCDGKDNNCNGQTDESCGCTKDDDCIEGWRCEAGSCKIISCVSPQIRCGRECVDIQSHPLHCGRCNAPCSGGNSCQAGVCRCGNGQSECNGVCVSLENNNTHCGGCGNACGDRKICAQGQCLCRSGFSDCSGDCADFLTDDKHCGECGKACRGFERCNNGACECRDNNGICGGVCVDIASDNVHCGGCNQPCDTLKTQCVSGKCACNSTHTLCAGVCVNTQYDKDFCGSCAKRCGAGEFCREGVCVSPLSVSVGPSHSCAITACGELRCWGDGVYLGYGDDADRSLPNHEFILSNTTTPWQSKQVAAGNTHTCGLLWDGSLFCWGKNEHGQLGYGHTNDLKKPASFALLFPKGRFVLQVAVGVTHTCVVLDDQSLRCWGDNRFGQLGYDDLDAASSPRVAPINVGTGRRVKAVAAGDSLTCALLDNATVKCWGKNDDGQLGYGDATPRFAPSILPIDVGAGRSVKSLSVGLADVCVILDDNTVKCWGKNNRGQLGYGDTTNRNKPDTAVISLGTNRKATQLFSGFGEHRCAFLDDGTARCWGANDKGQLGDGNSGQGKQQTAPASVPVDFGVGRSATSLSVGTFHSCAVLDNQQVVCWGDNTKGQLGSGDILQRLRPLDQSVDLGQALCGGLCVATHTNEHCGQCSVVCPPTQFCGNARCVPHVTALKISNGFVCTLQSNQEIRCWGKNTWALGYNSYSNSTLDKTTPDRAAVDFGANPSPKAIEVGPSVACAILNDDRLTCWGLNSYGELGVGDTRFRRTPASVLSLGTGRTAKAVALGDGHTCALLDNGSVKCWGRNNEGQLGDGSTVNKTAPPNDIVNLGAGRTAVRIILGATVSCAILDDGSLKCWGKYDSLSLPLPPPLPSAFSSLSPIPVDLGSGRRAVTMVLTKDQGATALLDNGQVKSFWLPFPQSIDLGAGRIAKTIVSGESHACALLDNNTVKCWGNNTLGQLGHPSGGIVDLGVGRTAVEVAVGENHTCAILDDGSVKCWGVNTQGQLGYGDLVRRPIPDRSPIDLGSGRTAKAIFLNYAKRNFSSQNALTCALLDNGAVKCWGYNGEAQLGYGDTIHRNAPLPHSVRYR